MSYPTSFSDRSLIAAAIDYSYRISRYDIHDDPIAATRLRLDQDFLGRYEIECVENVPIKRFNPDSEQEDIIHLRYLLLKDTQSTPFEYALIFQGSSSQGGSFLSGEGDWSNNFSNAVHLEVKSYQDAKDEFEYLCNTKGYNITAAAGNSLGGGLALSLAELSDTLRIIGVNPSPPQYGTVFVNRKYSTIINTSTDALTRVLPVDISRFKAEDTQQLMAILKDESKTSDVQLQEYDQYLKTLDLDVKFFYGVDHITIQRSLFYSEDLFFEGSHRGMILEPRQIAIDLFRDNLMYYTKHQAKTMLEITKELLHRHDKVSKSLTALIQSGDTKFIVDHYIEPILIPIHRAKYEDFRQFTSLAEFITFDIENNNLINADGTSYRDDTDFKVMDIQTFIGVLKQDQQRLKRNYQFPLNRLQHDLDEEKLLSNHQTDLKVTRKFFVDSFNLAIDLDMDMVDLVKNIPVPIISKLYVTKEHTLKFVKSLNAELNEIFFDQKTLEPTLNVDHYRQYYQDHLKEVNKALEMIQNQYDILIVNLEYALSQPLINIWPINKVMGHRLLKQFTALSEFNIVQPHDEDIDRKLIRKHRERVKEIVLDFRVEKVDDLILSSESMMETLTTTLNYINKELESLEVSEKNALKVISKQLNAMMENIEMPSLLFNFLEIYQDDIVALVLKDTVAQSIDTYYRQVKDTNDQLIMRINNLKQYIIKNTVHDIQKELLKQADEIIENIDKISAFIDNSI